jgi:hypothetical protein
MMTSTIIIIIFIYQYQTNQLTKKEKKMTIISIRCRRNKRMTGWDVVYFKHNQKEKKKKERNETKQNHLSST